MRHANAEQLIKEICGIQPLAFSATKKRTFGNCVTLVTPDCTGPPAAIFHITHLENRFDCVTAVGTDTYAIDWRKAALL